MKVTCTCDCGKKFRIDGKHAGKTVKCPQCGDGVKVPGAQRDAFIPVDDPPPEPVGQRPAEKRRPPVKPVPSTGRSSAPDKSPADAPAGLPTIDVAPARPSGKPVSTIAQRRGSQSPSPLVIGLVGGGAALALTVIVIVAVAFAVGGADSPEAADDAASATPARERVAPRPPPTAPAGGFDGSGGEFVGLPDAGPSGPPGYDGWLQDLERAKEAARRERKDILLAFVRSDADHDSSRIQNEVFLTADFLQLAKAGYVLAVFDQPVTQEGQQRMDDLAHSQSVAKDYSVSRVPTVMLADPAGRPYAVEATYAGQSGAGYIADLKRLRNNRRERDRVFAEVDDAAGEAKLSAAAAAAEWLIDRDLVWHYPRLTSDWIGIARRHDADNSKGQHETLFEAAWMVKARRTARDTQRVADLAPLVRDFDSWTRTRTFQNGERGARLHLACAQLCALTGNVDRVPDLIDAGLAFEPRDEEVRSRLELAKQAFSGDIGTGSGFVVGRGGYVLTNHHVVQGPGRVVVAIDGKRSPARVVAKDAVRDLALLKVEGPAAAGLSPLPLSAENAKLGAAVATYGFPLGDEQGSGLKFASGRVSGLPDIGNDRMLLLDVRINPGNSGGPLFDDRGRVVGMVTAKTIGGLGVDSYGMALPANDLRRFLKKHLDGFAAAPAGGDKLDWSDLTGRVDASVLMVIKVR